MKQFSAFEGMASNRAALLTSLGYAMQLHQFPHCTEETSREAKVLCALLEQRVDEHAMYALRELFSDVQFTSPVYAILNNTIAALDNFFDRWVFLHALIEEMPVGADAEDQRLCAVRGHDEFMKMYRGTKARVGPGMRPVPGRA